MDSANFPLSSSVMSTMTSAWAKQLKLSLLAKRKRISIRAKWQRIGKGWQPKGHTKKSFRANYVASGQLVNSIKAEGSGLDWDVSMESYANLIIMGRSKMGKAKGGKGIPIATMKDWAKSRKIKPRDMETGQFIKNTSANQNAMRFMFNRKIKHFGIEPYNFPKHTKEYILQEYKGKLTSALRKDIQQLIKSKIK
jgi:hypothetical protein